MKIPSDPGQRPGVIGTGLLNWFILASVPALVVSASGTGPGIPGIPSQPESWSAWAPILLQWSEGAQSLPGSTLPAMLFVMTRLAVASAVSLAWAGLFARIRHRPLDPGWFYHAWLFAMLVPAAVPLPLLIIGLSFGLLFACHVFGGTGRYIVNPVLLAAMFLLVSYPDTSWIDWMPGTLLSAKLAVACFGGALALILGRLASWRVVIGGLAGMLALATIFDSMPWYSQPVLGLFAFVLAFVATDPSTMPITRMGCWMFGILFGVGTVVIRMLNPEHPEGTLFALLLASLLTPLVDHWASASRAEPAINAHEHT